MAHAQKPDFVLRAKRTNPFKSAGGRQFSRLLAAEVVMLDTPCSEVVWRVLATHCIRQFPLHFPPVRHRVPSHFNWALRAVRRRIFCVTDGERPQPESSHCPYAMRRLKLRLTVPLVFHGLALGTRSHFSCIWRCLYWPFLSEQLLPIQHRLCSLQDCIKPSFICLQCYFRNVSAFAWPSSGKLFICMMCSACCLDICIIRSLTLKVKVKVKCTLVQALKLCTGRTAHRGSRGIAVLYRHWGSVQAVRPIGVVEV